MLDSGHDNIFQAKREKPTPFQFDNQVAGVFDNMIRRSVPGYELITDMTALFARKFFHAGLAIYDLGASIGSASMAIRAALDGETEGKIIAVDNSPAMVERCNVNLINSKGTLPFEVSCQNIQDFEMGKEQAGLVIMNYTLQFIQPQDRAMIIQKIYDSLAPGGVLLLSEKITFEELGDSQLFIDIYHDWKATRGYSPQEIVQKRDALENVLIPDTRATHTTRLAQAGFIHCEAWFQSFNFISFAAFKPC